MRTGGALVPQRLSPGTPQRTCHGGHSVRLTLRDEPEAIGVLDQELASTAGHNDAWPQPHQIAALHFVHLRLVL